MKLNVTNSSRRHFLERIAIASTVLIASPTILLANNSSKMLRFAVLGEDSALAKIINKSDKMTLIDDLKFADVIYVSKPHQKSQKYIQEALASGKHLIVESIGNNESLIEDCRKSGSLLAIVERSEVGIKLFKRVDYYESNLSQSSDFQKVILKLDFLVSNTQNDEFKVFSL
jgi:hypothetical protein